MCGNCGCGNSCIWIVLILIILIFCGGCGNSFGCGCGNNCGCDNGCGC